MGSAPKQRSRVEREARASARATVVAVVAVPCLVLGLWWTRGGRRPAAHGMERVASHGASSQTALMPTSSGGHHDRAGGQPGRVSSRARGQLGGTDEAGLEAPCDEPGRTELESHQETETDAGRSSHQARDGARGASSDWEFSRETYPDGSTTRAQGYVDSHGRRVGERQEFWPDGTKKLEGNYDQDQRHGNWNTYHEDGRIELEGQYVDDLREGRWVAWHENGERRQEVDYRRGQREGFGRAWYSNGQVKEAGEFKDGRREGYWQFYHYDGIGRPAHGDLQQRSAAALVPRTIDPGHWRCQDTRSVPRSLTLRAVCISK